MRLLSSALVFLTCLSTVVPGAAAQTDTAVENLRAFATLYGHVRYFHPSDEASRVDWDAFAVHGAMRVRGATNPADLRQALEELFLPVAPTLRIGRVADPAPTPPPELSAADTAGLEVVAWQHQGVGSGSANSPYRSLRTNRESVLTQGQAVGVLLQSVDPGGLRGKEVRLTGLGRVAASGARAQLWLRVDRPGGIGFFDNMMDRPVTSTTWTDMEIRGSVSTDADAVVLGVLILSGSAAFDDLRLEVREDGVWRSAPLKNGSFEETDDDGPAGWRVTSPGWEFRAEAGGAPAGNHYLAGSPGVVTVSGPVFDGHARPGDIAEVSLGRGLVAYVPLALWSREGKTLGDATFDARQALDAALASTTSVAWTAADEAVRLAGVIMAWNVFEHFYPYWDVVDTDWDAVLTSALNRALVDRDGDDHLTALRAMVAGLKDGHGRVEGPGAFETAGLPFRVRWIEDEVVVVVSDTSAVHPGDVIRSIDGRSAAELVSREVELQSGSPGWRRWRALEAFGRGQVETSVSVELERQGGIHRVSVDRKTGQPPREPRPDPIAELRPGVFYVDLGRAAMPEIARQLDSLAAADGVIFDLRGYPNGNHDILTYLSDEPLQSAHWRIPQITRPDWRNDPRYWESRWNLQPRQPRFQGRIVFLTDERAISYAESVMGIVEHYRLGDIIGGFTAGANGNVNTFTLPGGYGISWTGMRVVKHDGSQHHLVGIRPTIPAAPTIEGIRTGRDEVLERAIELLEGR
jgi:C-terminal processing protease CtpA/Prc